MKVIQSFKTIDFEQINECKSLRKAGANGFAETYLYRCNKESESNEVIDINLYEKLLAVDMKLGTTASDQLYCCLFYTTRSDIIKVKIHYLNESYRIILDYRF